MTLWTLVLVSLLVLQLSEAGGAQARLGDNLRRAAVAEAAADGAVSEAVFRLLGDAGWSSAGGTYQLAVEGGRATVEVRNEAGRIDLNGASPQLLAALLGDLGADPREAAALVEQIVAWHTPASEEQRRAIDAPYRAAGRTLLPPLAPFQSVSEAGMVLGMTPALLARLAPLATVFGSGDPVASLADPVLRRALAQAGGTGTAQTGFDPEADDVVRLTVTVTVGGARFTRRAVVELQPGEDQEAFRILAWG